ncbi:MAG: hypothetical protein R6U94_05650 [Nitriliruptoraceae bacterium]
MSYDYERLVSWQHDLADETPPAGMTSFGIDAEAGVLELVVRPDHDEVALQRLLQRLPSDAVRVVISNANWFGYGPTSGSDTK